LFPCGGQLLLGQLPHLRVREQLLRRGSVRLRLPVCLVRLCHRSQVLQLPIHSLQPLRVAIDRRVCQLGLQVLIPQGQLLQFFQHGASPLPLISEKGLPLLPLQKGPDLAEKLLLPECPAHVPAPQRHRRQMTGGHTEIHLAINLLVLGAAAAGQHIGRVADLPAPVFQKGPHDGAGSPGPHRRAQDHQAVVPQGTGCLQRGHGAGVFAHGVQPTAQPAPPATPVRVVPQLRQLRVQGGGNLLHGLL
ncbi:YebC/PmpR family DNA-binding transcriptional regulator, partial [Dysosmobacter welbionis]